MICLCMIVKNESELIRTALQSVKSYIQKWSIVDTGSTDNTIDIIREEMKDIPGTLHNREWKDYGSSRTEAIELAKEQGCDFTLILDADEELSVPDGSVFQNLDTNKAYWATIKYGGISYSRPNLISAKQDWKYVGVTHEYLGAFPTMPEGCLLPITIQTHPSRCTKSAERCKEDERLLRKGLESEPENSRYVFYLAQSLRDYSATKCAIDWYKKRTEMGGWYEEVWCSHFQIGQLKEKLFYPVGEVVEAYLAAYNIDPLRSESLGALARYLRLAGQYHSALLFSEKAKSMGKSDRLLFVDESYHKWRNLDEYSVSCYWTGHYVSAAAACHYLLKSGDLPEYEVERVKKNMAFAEEKLASNERATATT